MGEDPNTLPDFRLLFQNGCKAPAAAVLRDALGLSIRIPKRYARATLCPLVRLPRDGLGQRCLQSFAPSILSSPSADVRHACNRDHAKNIRERR